ncbi:MAG: DUF1549 domain-containing protein [Verrucomicrobiota bacterium]
MISHQLKITVCTATALLLAHLTHAETPVEKINALVSKHLDSKDLQPLPFASEEQLVRRTYLGIIGRIPTAEEAAAYLTSDAPDKHEKLIQTLISNDKAYTAHHFHFYADLLRIPDGGHWTLVYQEWMREQIEQNVHFNDLSRRLVSGHGLVFDDPAAAYYLMDSGMPLDNMSNTVRVFLGTRLECAQCHDHPFDKWTQMDFYRMAAFTYDFDHRGGGANRSKMHGILRSEEKQAYLDAVDIEGFPYFHNTEAYERWSEKYRPKYLEQNEMTLETFGSLVEKGMAAEASLAEYNAPIHKNISQLGNFITQTKVRHLDGPLTLPHDYQYGDADPHDVVEPGTMFGLEIPKQKDQMSRKLAYAEWLTSAENPTFTKVIVNRLWKRTFGHGLFEPVDDLTDHTYITNKELLAYLEELMKEVDYDVREFQKVLFATELFRREAYTKDHFMGVPFNFEGPLMKRMSAEQIWDSIVTLVLPEIDTYEPNRPKVQNRIARTIAIHKSMEGTPAEEVIERMRKAGENSRVLAKIEESYQERIQEAYRKKDNDLAKELYLEIRKIQGETSRKNQAEVFIYVNDDNSAEPAMMGMMGMTASPSAAATTAANQEFLKNTRPRKAPENIDPKDRKHWEMQERRHFDDFRRVAREMSRAIDQGSPSRRGHFLRDFGQSDRAVIENASSHASVPQALYLLNSPLAVAVHNSNSVLGAQLEAAETPEEKIKTIYRVMLTREANEREIARVMEGFEAHGEEIFQDLVWVLLNSRQFMFIL